MRQMRRNVMMALMGAAVCGVLAGCGKKGQTDVTEPEGTTAQIEIQTESKAGDQKGNEAETAAESGSGRAGYVMIQDQTFEVELEPLGKVTFASYAPGEQADPLADVRFEIQKDGETIQVLDGGTENEVRANEMFHSVEAVSFPDYNVDGFNDIIIICNYSPASGPEVGTGYSEVRLYSGNADGTFALEGDLAEVANSALAEKTVKSVLGFLGIGRKENGINAELAGWQKAYIDHLEVQYENQWQGYHLIYLDSDTMPELVKVGVSEAAGCGIVTYADGAAVETQLQRLNFTYLEGEGLLCNSDGNMDVYYDIVYQMKDGRLVEIAAGNYGAEDNSNVQYDESGQPVYVYDWNDQSMTKEEYDQALNAVFDTSRAQMGFGYDMLLSKDEMIEVIRGLQS